MSSDRVGAIAVSLCVHGVALALVCQRTMPVEFGSAPGTLRFPAGFLLVETQSDQEPEVAPPQVELPVPVAVDPQVVREPPFVLSASATAQNILIPSISPSGMGFTPPSGGKLRIRRATRGGGAGRGTSSARGDYTPPRYVHSPAPAYPAEAQRGRQAGIVLLAVRVGADGRAEAIAVKRSSGSRTLDDAAIRAVQTWRFEPAQLGGQKITASVEIPVRFRFARALH